MAFGKTLKLVSGENVVDVDDWNKVKEFPHVAERIANGDLIEGERHMLTPESLPEPNDSDVGSDDDNSGESKRKRKRKKSN